jgi:Chromosome segregation ATPases
MKYFIKLSADEIKEICLAYPLKEISSGFRKFSKDFSTLMPGHRPQTVNGEAGRKLIFNNLRSDLTAKMVEALLCTWVPKVTTAAEQQMNNGRSKDIAYILTFSELGMPECIPIYFRLVGEEISEERTAAICSGVEALLIERTEAAGKADAGVALTYLKEERSKHEEELREKNLEFKSKVEEIKALSAELTVKDEQIKSLSVENLQIEKLHRLLDAEEEKLSSLTAEKKKLENRLTELQKKNEIAQLTIQQQYEATAELHAQSESWRLQLEEVTRASKELMFKTYRDSSEELRPVDTDDFTEHLTYNLKSLGISDTSDFWAPLICFLTEILFQNKPIICNQEAGMALAHCISNTLCGNSEPVVLPYSEGISGDVLRAFLMLDSRVVVLDSFLGNYNDMELLSILKSVKRKIVFVTIEYDRTMAYLPEELLCHCTYLNVNRIGEFFLMNGVAEEPSEIQEELITPVLKGPNQRAQRLCKEIMLQLGFSAFLAETISAQMASEEKLIGYLAFSILPYSLEVFETSPYGVSERLQKYAGTLGKCQQKELLMRWFGDE